MAQEALSPLVACNMKSIQGPEPQNEYTTWGMFQKYSKMFLKGKQMGAEEMLSKQLRACTALAEDLSLGPSTHGQGLATPVTPVLGNLIVSFGLSVHRNTQI